MNAEQFRDLLNLLPALIPLFLLELGLLVVALVDLVRRPHVWGNRVVWILVIVFFQIIGPILYLTIGRKERAPDRDQD